MFPIYIKMGLFYFMFSFKEYLSSWQPVNKAIAEHTPPTCPARPVALGACGSPAG